MEAAFAPCCLPLAFVSRRLIVGSNGDAEEAFSGAPCGANCGCRKERSGWSLRRTIGRRGRRVRGRRAIMSSRRVRGRRAVMGSRRASRQPIVVGTILNGDSIGIDEVEQLLGCGLVVDYAVPSAFEQHLRGPPALQVKTLCARLVVHAVSARSYRGASRGASSAKLLVSGRSRTIVRSLGVPVLYPRPE